MYLLSDDIVLSKLLEEKISSPNRLFVTDECYAAVSIGFPELESSSNELYCWFKPEGKPEWSGLQGKSIFLEKTSQVGRF